MLSFLVAKTGPFPYDFCMEMPPFAHLVGTGAKSAFFSNCSEKQHFSLPRFPVEAGLPWRRVVDRPRAGADVLEPPRAGADVLEPPRAGADVVELFKTFPRD